MKKESQPKAKLYYDGTCPMCTAFASQVAKEVVAPSLIDATTTSAPPAPVDRLLEEIHLYEEDGSLRTGADAILTTLARTRPWLSPIRDLFRLPGLYQIARLSYRFVARRRRLWFGSETSRLYWVYLIANIGLLASVLLTWPLWGTDRMYPLVPIIPALEPLTSLSIILASALLISIVASTVTIAKQSLFALTTTILLTLLVLMDQTRLQPWVWHYGSMLALFSFWKPLERVSSERLTLAMMAIVVGIYFWSGIQKINTAFFTEVFPWFTETLAEPFGLMGMTVFFSLGIFIPFIESTLAIGLLTARFRRTALLTALAMHILVLSALMIGHDWNSSVWPWNVALFGMAVALFVGRKESIIELWRKISSNRFAHITILLFIIMPVGNFFGLTHHYLSWSLYSGHVPTAYLTTDTDLINTIAPEAETIPENNGQETLPFVHYTMTTLNAVPYPETPLFIAIFTNLCSTYPDHDMTLSVVTRPLFLSHLTTTTSYTCTPR